MLGDAVSVGAGMGAGGLLGQLGSALSYPRRALWGALGLPEQGTQLMGQLGMDEQSPLTQALGFGAEVAGDPLSYLGAGLGLAGRLGSRAFRGAGLAGEAADLAGAARPATNLGTIEARGINPLGGFPDYVPPPPPGPQSESAIWKALMGDAEQSAARETAQGAPAGLSPLPAGEGPGRSYFWGAGKDPIEQKLGLLEDLVGDTQHGMLDRSENLVPRLELMDKVVQTPPQLTPGVLPNPRAPEDHLVRAISPEHRAALARIEQESAVLQELLNHEPLGPAAESGMTRPWSSEPPALLHGLGPEARDHAANLAMSAGNESTRRLGSLGRPTGPVELAGPPRPGALSQDLEEANLPRRVYDILDGSLPPEQVSPLLAQLEGLGLPINRQGIGTAYLGGVRENLTQQIPDMARQLHTNPDVTPSFHPDTEFGQLGTLLGQNRAQQALHQLQGITEVEPGIHTFFEPAYLGTPEYSQQVVNPLIAELLAHIRQQAGIH